MLGNLTGWHLVIILFLVLLLFGAPKLPGLARSVGQSMKIFKSEIKNDDKKNDDNSTDAAGTTGTTSTASTPEPTQSKSSPDEPTNKS